MTIQPTTRQAQHPRYLVLIVDDDALVRAGLTMMLAEFDDIEVAAAVADGTEVMGAVSRHRLDSLVLLAAEGKPPC